MPVRAGPRRPPRSGGARVARDWVERTTGRAVDARWMEVTDWVTLAPVPSGQRRLLAWLTAAAVAVAVLQAITGTETLVVYFAPFLLLVALLLCDRYLG